MSKNILKSSICLFLVFLFLGTMFIPYDVSSKTIDELKKEKEKLTQQIEQKKQELEAIKDEVRRKQALVEQYEEQRQAMIDLIDITQELIDQIKINLTETQKNLDAKERELKQYYHILGKRLRYIHMNDSTSMIALILGADSFSDALVIGQYMTKVSENDTRIIDEITAIRDDIESMRNSINRDLADQETLMDENVIARERFTELVEEAKVELNYAQAAQYKTQEHIQQLIEEQERAQAEINSLMAVWSDIPYMGDVFRWPVPGFSHISSGYGWRTLYGVQNFHAGIDIAGSGIYGAAVVASDHGIVSTVIYSSVGYGNYIIIDHGGGFMSLYGHLSSIFVTKGEEVKQGDAIGAVGSTGNSTGPHLHFEIRLKGDKLDPINEAGLLNY